MKRKNLWLLGFSFLLLSGIGSGTSMSTYAEEVNSTNAQEVKDNTDLLNDSNFNDLNNWDGDQVEGVQVTKEDGYIHINSPKIDSFTMGQKENIAVWTDYTYEIRYRLPQTETNDSRFIYVGGYLIANGTPGFLPGYGSYFTPIADGEWHTVTGVSNIIGYPFPNKGVVCYNLNNIDLAFARMQKI